MAEFKETVQVKKTQNRFAGFFQTQSWTLRHRLFSGKWSRWLDRELSLHTPAIGVLALLPESKEVVLTKQFRPGALAAKAPNPWLIEIVAGLIDSDESPEQVAKREMQEEVGCVIDNLTPIYHYLTTPGSSNESLRLYYSCLKTPPVEKYSGLGSEDEDIEILVVSWQQAFRWLADGTINNATTLIALQWLQLNQGKISC